MLVSSRKLKPPQCRRAETGRPFAAPCPCIRFFLPVAATHHFFFFCLPPPEDFSFLGWSLPFLSSFLGGILSAHSTRAAATVNTMRRMQLRRAFRQDRRRLYLVLSQPAFSAKLWRLGCIDRSVLHTPAQRAGLRRKGRERGSFFSWQAQSGPPSGGRTDRASPAIFFPRRDSLRAAAPARPHDVCSETAPLLPVAPSRRVPTSPMIQL